MASGITITLIPPSHDTSASPRHTVGHLDIIKTLADTITLSNMRVKKPNLLKRQHQLDMSSTQPVLDDEEESPIPDIGSFLSIPQVLPNSFSLIQIWHNLQK